MDGRAAAAAENFFKDTHLTALRELALRFVAEHVDKRLRELRSVGTLKTVWRSGERLLVAVGAEPVVDPARPLDAAHGRLPGRELDRRQRRVLRPLDADAQRRLEKNLSLARELGAEVVVTHDTDVADALVRVALQNNATQIVVGKSRNPRWLDLLRGGNLVDRLLRIGGHDRHLRRPRRARAEKAHHVARLAARRRSRPAASTPRSSASSPRSRSPAGSSSPTPATSRSACSYLLAVIVLSLRVGPGPVLVAGVASALTWDFLFIPPIFTFASPGSRTA
jgi:two-component system sensor histidine kinase KdpD